MKKQNGITLIALIITVIVMLILAGITISLTVGENGIITRAKQAADQAKIAEIKDRMQLEILDAETDAVIRGETLEEAQLSDIIAKYGELQEDGDTIITHEDKYEMSLKEIWYGVLSNSGSYTDKLEQIEILEKELADLKEEYKNLEELNSGNSEVLANLQNQIATLESEKSAIEEEYKEYREIITQAIREAGIEVDVNEVATKVAENIKNILAEATKDATATEEDILSGKTAWVNGNKITGKMAYNGAISKTLNAGESYTVPAGYTTGGTIVANSLASQTQADATADNITQGKTAWVNGKLVTGTGADEKAKNLSFTIQTYGQPNITSGSNQYPVKNIDVSNYTSVTISGSISAANGNNYIRIIADEVVINKITSPNNNINLRYDISNYSTLSVHVFAAYNNKVSTSLRINLTV